MATKTQTLFCEKGKHEWIRETTRGKLPKSCPEHKVVLTVKHKQKMQTAREHKKKEREETEVKQEQSELRATIKRLQDHVAKTGHEEDKLYAKYKKVSSDKNFNIWIRSNSNLLNAITALRAHEERQKREE
jgi:septal ring factor EnvC (AmiA/AmiB activator)